MHTNELSIVFPAEERENAIPNDLINKEIHYLTLQKELTKLQGWSIQKLSDILQGLCLLC